MSQTSSAQGGAVPPPTPIPPPAIAVAVAVAPAPGRFDRVRTRIESMGAVATIVGGIGAMVVAGVATTSGWVRDGYDWVTSASQTQSQMTAMDERMKAFETFKATVEADRAEAARQARTLDDTTRELARQGADVAALRDVQRQVEMRVERLDGILEILRERRR